MKNTLTQLVKEYLYYNIDYNRVEFDTFKNKKCTLNVIL